MKTTQLILAVCVLLMGLSSCEETENKAQPLASLNVVAAVVGGGNVKLNANERDSAMAFNSKTFGFVPGKEIRLYRTNNPSVNYYKETPATENGSAYSVFLAGQGSTFEPIFIKENLPAFYKDSIFGVRVVNLSPNSTPMNVTLASAPGIIVFSNVGYKEVTGFTTFPLRTVIPAGSVTFQIRDSTGELLATYTLPDFGASTYPRVSVRDQRFKNISIVIKGLMGTTIGPDAFGVFPVVTAL